MTDRFTLLAGGKQERLLIDNLTKKTYNNLDETCTVMNNLWEMVQRFEKYNQELVQRSIDYEELITTLKLENTSLRNSDNLIDCESKISNFKIILTDKINELEHDLEASIKAGMPTGGLYGELDTLYDLLYTMFPETKPKEINLDELNA